MNVSDTAIFAGLEAMVVIQVLVIGWMWERYGWQPSLWFNAASVTFSIVMLGTVVL